MEIPSNGNKITNGMQLVLSSVYSFFFSYGFVSTEGRQREWKTNRAEQTVKFDCKANRKWKAQTSNEWKTKHSNCNFKNQTQSRNSTNMFFLHLTIEPNTFLYFIKRRTKNDWDKSASQQWGNTRKELEKIAEENWKSFVFVSNIAHTKKDTERAREREKVGEKNVWVKASYKIV